MTVSSIIIIIVSTMATVVVARAIVITMSAVVVTRPIVVAASVAAIALRHDETPPAHRPRSGPLIGSGSPIVPRGGDPGASPSP